MSEKITDQQIAAYKEAFSLFDKDGDGNLTSGELGTALRALGHPVSEDDVSALIAEVGTDQAGTIDFPEFLAMISRRKIPGDSQAARDALSVLGVLEGENGQIPAAELRRLLVSAGEPLSGAEVDALIKEVDNGSGLVSLEDLTKLLCK